MTLKFCKFLTILFIIFLINLLYIYSSNNIKENYKNLNYQYRDYQNYGSKLLYKPNINILQKNSVGNLRYPSLDYLHKLAPMDDNPSYYEFTP